MINITKKDNKNILTILTLAGLAHDMIGFVIDYKTPEEKEEVNEKMRRYFEAVYKSVVLYLKSSESQKKAILSEILKLGEKQAVADLHEILGINTPDISNEMTFTNPYQYNEDR